MDKARFLNLQLKRHDEKDDGPTSPLPLKGHTEAIIPLQKQKINRNVEPAKATCKDERTGVFVNYASVTYSLGMIFIGTPVFTKLIEHLLAHDNYVLIKEYLE